MKPLHYTYSWVCIYTYSWAYTYTILYPYNYTMLCYYCYDTYRPMKCINIDFVGPYPDKGYVLTFIDTFTRWVELYPEPEATAEQVAKCLLQHFGRFCSPTTIRQRLTLCQCCHRTLLRCCEHANKLHLTILFPRERYCRTNK